MTQKDREFLEILKKLMESHELQVELRLGKPSYMVLRGTYGDHINKAFHMTRQGVRWRFQRLFNDIYVSSFETILFIEKTFGPQLREHAVRISRERYDLRQRITKNGFQSADSLVTRRQTSNEPASGQGSQLTSDLPAELVTSKHEGIPFRKSGPGAGIPPHSRNRPH